MSRRIFGSRVGRMIRSVRVARMRVARNWFWLMRSAMGGLRR